MRRENSLMTGGWVSRETGRLGGGGWWVAASAPTEEIGAEGVDGRTGGCGAGIGTIGGLHHAGVPRPQPGFLAGA